MHGQGGRCWFTWRRPKTGYQSVEMHCPDNRQLTRAKQAARPHHICGRLHRTQKWLSAPVASHGLAKVSNGFSPCMVLAPTRDLLSAQAAKEAAAAQAAREAAASAAKAARQRAAAEVAAADAAAPSHGSSAQDGGELPAPGPAPHGAHEAASSAATPQTAAPSGAAAAAGSEPASQEVNSQPKRKKIVWKDGRRVVVYV